MATNLFESCKNPISGETFKAISFNKNAYVMEWTVQPKGYVPFEHIHLHQDEIFQVKSGKLKILMDGKVHFAQAGEVVTVPKGVAHLASNDSDEVLECVVKYTPGLDYDVFMQCLCGLTNDGFLDKKGGIDVPKMGYCLVKMNTQSMARPTAIPAPLFNIALRFFYLRGVLSGWKKLYEKYTTA